MRLSFLVLIFLFPVFRLPAQVVYPAAVSHFSLSIEGQPVSMAYMDISPAKPWNGKTILLLHGKNFNGYYWKNLIPFLSAKGFRVLIPDQVGWGQSDHPDIHYSFHLLAHNTKLLLDSLHIARVTVLGHSMGGMLAVRFSLMFPGVVEKLILEDPIGLEDYKTFVPYQPFDSLYQKEKKATYDSYKKYQQSYYPVWKPEYDQYVQAQGDDLKNPDFDKIAKANAYTFQMIYEQPVCYELARLTMPTLLVIGLADRTIAGKDLLSEPDKKLHGQYPQLGRFAHSQIRRSILKELPGIGHIPHIQDLPVFIEAIGKFLMDEEQ